MEAGAERGETTAAQPLQVVPAVRDKRGRWEARHKQAEQPGVEAFYCEPCNFRTDNPWKFKRHHSTQKHLLCSGSSCSESSSPCLVQEEGGESEVDAQRRFGYYVPSDPCKEGGPRTVPQHRKRASPTARAIGCGERRSNSTRKSAISAQEKVGPETLIGYSQCLLQYTGMYE